MLESIQPVLQPSWVQRGEQGGFRAPFFLRRRLRSHMLLSIVDTVYARLSDSADQCCLLLSADLRVG